MHLTNLASSTSIQYQAWRVSGLWTRPLGQDFGFSEARKFRQVAVRCKAVQHVDSVDVKSAGMGELCWKMLEHVGRGRAG